MTIKTSSVDGLMPFLKNIFIPRENSHKGQNGKILIVGGSKLFHAASLWSAEVASHMVDMVHFASTEENNDIMLSLKKSFRNGIVVPRSEIDAYIGEDDAVLLGPGLDRSEETKKLTEMIIHKHPEKKFVIDAGSLQMMNPQFLQDIHTAPIITPHLKEYETLFHCSIDSLSPEQKASDVQKRAKEYSCVILLKAVIDIVSDGKSTYIIEGGNQGLTKGGTGDILAGLTTGFFAKNPPVESCVLASYCIKRAADKLFSEKGYWYNNTDIINTIPLILKELFI